MTNHPQAHDTTIDERLQGANTPSGAIGGCPMADETQAGIRWYGVWITPPGEKNRNYYFLARKEFQVAVAPARALLQIAADARYAAYAGRCRPSITPYSDNAC